MAKHLQSLSIILFSIALVGGGAYGWGSNIVKLAHTPLDPLTGIAIVRAIGIPIVPVGVVMGFVP